MDLYDAEEYVRQVRRDVVGRIDEALYLAEGKVAQYLDGPIEIPPAGSAMSDHWDAIRAALGGYACNFTIAGERIFVRSRRGRPVGGLGTGTVMVGVRIDTLDALLDRYDPGSANTNDALRDFTRDLQAIAELRDQRGAIMRDGLVDPRVMADTALELAALTGTLEQAVVEVVAVDAETDLELWEDFHAAERAALLEAAIRGKTFEPECDTSIDMEAADPVGIKEVGDRLGVKRQTVDQWLQRKLLPAPRWTIGGRPAWDWSDVETWARATGRLA